MDKSILLGNETETGDPVRLQHSERRYGTFILGKPGTGKVNTLLRLALHDIEAGYPLYFLDPHVEQIFDLLQRIGRPFQDRLLFFDPTHDTHTFCINPLRCPDPTDPRQRTEAYARTYSILNRLLTAELSYTHPFLAGMAETSNLKLLIRNIILVFLENQEYCLSELPLFLENRQFREYLLGNVHYHPEAVSFWKEQFLETDSSVIVAWIAHLFTNPTVQHILGGAETTIDLLSFLDEKKIILVSFSKDIAPEHKACISCLLFSELLSAIKKRVFDPNKPLSIYVSELHELPAPEDFLELFFNARLRGVITTFSASELREEFVNSSPIRRSITSAANIFFQLTAKDAWTLASELIQNLPPPRPGFEDEEVITPTSIEHLWEHASPLECVAEYRERYFWPVEHLKAFPKAVYFHFALAIEKKVLTVNSPFPLDFTIFASWVCYRSSAAMLREGIRLLNDYYYRVMTGRIDLLHPPSEEQLDLFVQVLDCFAGLFGYYPTLTPDVPDAPKGTYPEKTEALFAILRDYTQLSKDPVTHVQAWRLKVTLKDLQELDPLLRWWHPHAGLPQRGMILREVIRARLLWLISVTQRAKSQDADTAFASNSSEKASQLLSELFLPKDINFQREKAIAKAILHTALWQREQVSYFINDLFFFCPFFLSKMPIRVPRRTLDEVTKREQRYQEYRADLAQELSSLPRFTAYLKTNKPMKIYVDDFAKGERNWFKDINKFRALSLPQEEGSASDIGRKRAHVSLQAIFLQTLPYLYPHDLLEAEIRKRQEPWQSPPTLPPAPVRLL